MEGRMRRDHRRWLSGLVPVLLIVFGSAATAGETAPRPPDPVTSTDVRVLSTALEHFASSADATDLHVPATKKPRLVLDVKSPSGLGVSSAQLRSNTERLGWSVPESLAEDLRRRNGEAVSFKGQPFGQQIVVKDPQGHYRGAHKGSRSQQRRIFRDRRAYAQAWLPGYSEDGRQAVVCFWFGPTSHDAMATYLLVKEAAGWRVQRHTFTYFL
jgi:hypothetical protein